MGKFILKRIFLSIITIVAISIISFSFIHLIPGDPITLMFGKMQNQELIEKVKAHYNLDKPIIYQYFLWIKGVIAGDLGTSIIKSFPVSELIFERIPRTLILAVFGIAISLLLTIPLGIISAYKHNKLPDVAISGFSLFLLSVPEWWWGLILILLISVQFGLLPSSGYIPPTVDFIGFLKIIIMPSIALGLASTAASTRMLRTTMIDILQQDYIKLVKAYGVKNIRILLVHGFRNALLPVITIVGIQFGYLLGGEVIIERVFSYPGLGLLLWQSLEYRDYPTIQGIILIFSSFFVLVNLMVDVMYVLINPIIRYK